jgi:predicted HAD superfamily phosphohydrolase YqeG
MRFVAALLMLSGALALQGCVAAIIPVAAVGLLGKTQVDAAKRTRKAEYEVDTDRKKRGKPTVTVGGPPAQEKAVTSGVLIIPGNDEFAILDARSLPTPSRHPYLKFAEFALSQAQRRDEGLGVPSAVLTEQVSLVTPQSVPCQTKPLAVMIDLDAAPIQAVPSEGLTRPLGSLFEDMRNAGIRLIWVSGRREIDVDSTLDPLRQGINPAIKPEDLISLQEGSGMRKQERRWNLAQYYCIVAVAGDQKSDFDELFEYLRNPEYAVSLDKYWDNGWFMVPHPTSVAAPEIEDTTPQTEETE